MWKIIRAKCEDALERIKPESFDALITDPPYGMGDVYNLRGLLRAWMRWDSGMEYVSPGGFMREEWDKCVPPPFIWAEIMDKMKPGAHGLVFASARTLGLMDISLRLAGFDVRDSIDWIYSSGFPKSTNDKERGLGTALKPAHEPIIMVRKPLSENSIKKQDITTGTGYLNIRKCEVISKDKLVRPRKKKKNNLILGRGLGAGRQDEPDGRWPPNLLFSHSPDCEENGLCAPDCPVAYLQLHAGIRRRGSHSRKGKINYCGGCKSKTAPRKGYEELGYADIFYPCFRYIPKASKKEREAGLEELPTLMLHRVNPGGLEHDAKWAPVERKNPHPTVKPISLLEWLCDLVVPENGRVLDPFIGSGSFGCAAVRKGIDFLGIEKDERYAEIARARIEFCERMAA